MDRHGRCVHHFSPDTINLKPISTWLRQDQLRRGGAGSHRRSACLAEVTGSPGEWREPWWLGAVCIRNVLRFPLPTLGWLPLKTSGERFFHWMWVKRQRKSGGFSKEVIHSWLKPSARKKERREKRGCMTLKIKMGGRWEGVRGSVGEGTEREWLAFMDCRCGAVGFWQGPCALESFTGWVAPRWGGGHRTATRSP